LRACAGEQEGEEGTEAVTREQVSEALGGADGGVAFVKYSRGGSEGYVRFHTPAQAKAGLESAGEEKEKLLGAPSPHRNEKNTAKECT
jgi:hypothetical protein